MSDVSTVFPQGVRVMIVEDEALIADEIEDRLMRLGCSVVGVCDNAASALTIAQAEQPDLALMDIRIKGPVDGIDAARDIYNSLDIPVVFLTAHSDRATLDRALGTLPFGYVLKPFKEQELLLAMELALRRVAVERSLRESNITRGAILESVQEGVLAIDAGARIRYLNQSAERLTGWNLGDALGKDIQQVLDLRDEVTGASLLEAAMSRQPGADAPFTGHVNSRLGDTMLAEVSLKPIEHLGVRLGWSVTVHDISALRLARRLEDENRQMRETSRLKSLFLANMSHELRTPLNAVLGFADLLRGGYLPPGSQKHDEFLGLIAENGRHLLRLINDVLDLSKVEAGKLEFRPERFDARRLIEDVMQTLSVQARERQVSIVSTVSPGLESLNLDALRLKQVLFNFLSNAIKFTPAGGRVDVRALPENESRWRLEVEDTGIGIDAKDLPTLFIEFGQLYSSAQYNPNGTGLGLALTKRLVEAQGGQVGVHSERGVGSCFFAVLPRDATADIDQAPLLLAMQQEQTSQRVGSELAASGLKVHAARDADSLLQLGESHRYGAMAITLSPPDAPGLQALAAVRERGASSSTPVRALAISAEPHGEVAFAVTEVLSKPLQTDELWRALQPIRTRTHAQQCVLVVDDEHSARELMRATLEAVGIPVVVVDGGAAALGALPMVRPGAIVLDLLMPEVDGFQVLDAIRRDPEWAELPVLVWTAMSLSKDDFERLHASAVSIAIRGDSDSAQVIRDALLSWVDESRTAPAGARARSSDRAGA